MTAGLTRRPHRLAVTLLAVAISMAVLGMPSRVSAQLLEPNPAEETARDEGDEVEKPKRADHKLASASAVAGFYAALGTWAYFAWYHNVDELPEFTVGGDGWFGYETYAGGSDKLGHFWANYVITRGTSRLLELGGWDTLPASAIAGGLSWTFFAFVEIKDGFYYQLSIGDTVFNTIGVVLGGVMENVPAIDRLLDFRLEYFPSKRFRQTLTEEGDIDIAEDYSGQTYHVALHLGALPFIAGRDWLRWARYIDVIGGFEGRNYRPLPPDDAVPDRRQSLFLGVSINLQHALREAFGGPPKRIVHKVGHDIAEVYSPPYTTLRVTESIREHDRIEAAGSR